MMKISSSGRVSDSSIGLYWLYEFAISHTRNKFTSIGYDTIAYITSSIIGLNYSTGCLTFCGSVNDVINRSCSGIGCCQTAIPRGMRGYEFNFDIVGTIPFQQKGIPTYFLLANRDTKCTEAQRDTQNYACKGNIVCIDPDNNVGYLCKCVDGFQGNPYLGCQGKDILSTSPPLHIHFWF
ncbi:hypothetical protein GQ457_18G014370 [Hibiscus cannabinus]